MFRVINTSNRAIIQRVNRWSWNITRAQVGTDAEAGSVASGNDAFSKREHAEEARWARRHDQEAWSKYKTEHPAGGTPQQRLAALEAEKQRIEQEIAALKKQKQ